MTSRDDKTRAPDDRRAEFARQAENASGGLLREYFNFLRDSKKWWLTPIIVVLLLFGVIVALGSGVVAPFIYTLF